MLTNFVASKLRGRLNPLPVGRLTAVFAALQIAALAVPATAHAVTSGFGTYALTQSNAFGTGSFGSVTVSALGANDANILVNVSPNFLLDTGSHFATTFSLAGGSVDTTSFSSSHFSLVPGSGPFSNSPFGTFTSAIQADCTQGNCGPTLGSSFSFNVLNFAGLNPATGLFNGLAILFAVDISRAGCSGDGCTGVVGAPQVSQVPLPAAAVLFGSALVGLGVLGRRRKKQYPLQAV
jgi:hypothetical protein